MASVAGLIISSLLILISLLSFIPQIHKIFTRSDHEHISIYYVLFNAIVATHGLSWVLFLHILLYRDAKPDYGIYPPSANDWLNLFQHSVVWLGHVIIFISCLKLPPTSITPHRTITATFIIYISLTLLPTLIMATLPKPKGSHFPLEDHMYEIVLSQVLGHLQLIATISAVLAFVFQFEQLRQRRSPGAVSLGGLAVQAVVFTILAIAWIWRAPFPWGAWGEPPEWVPPALVLLGTIKAWYELVGWALINYGIFAVGQGLLFVFARRSGISGLQSGAGEETPLLR